MTIIFLDYEIRRNSICMADIFRILVVHGRTIRMITVNEGWVSKNKFQPQPSVRTARTLQE